MPDKSPDQQPAPTRQNVLVRARNGDVIRFDDTGLVLRLSDRVIADIALRLGAAVPAGEAASPPTSPMIPASTISMSGTSRRAANG